MNKEVMVDDWTCADVMKNQSKTSKLQLVVDYD